MTDMLNRLYKGKIRPEEEYRPGKEIKERQNELAIKREELRRRLLKKDQQMEQELAGIFEEMETIAAALQEDACVYGMRIGAELMLGLMKKT